MLEMYSNNVMKFAAKSKLQDLANEFCDIIETEYFETALFEIIDQGYNKDFKNLIIQSLTEDGKLYKSKEREALP